MVFSSHIFIFYFLPLALIIYFVTSKKWRNAVLTIFSYVFYGWGEPVFVLLLLLSTAIDWCCGIAIMSQAMPHNSKAPNKKTAVPEKRDGKMLLHRWNDFMSRIPDSPLERGGIRSKRQRIALMISICSNLGLLAFFKYCDFGISNWNTLVQVCCPEADSWMIPLLHITLPLGISFYTFQSMSYSIDVYRGDAKGVRNLIDFACYVSLFPQLVAGPIVRFQEVANQLKERTHSWAKAARGIAFFIIGMGQKILLANPCGQMADAVFTHEGRSALEAWWGLSAYALQIFFDFAGYSNMAIGLGLILGFVFPRNFDSPYHSFSITEFWRRWHISLSTWLRDYLYIPLGGNRKGRGRTYLNLFLVMFLGGLWHGASWTFVAWGTIHGLLLMLERAIGVKPNPPKHVGWKIFRYAYTMVSVMVAWVFFRSDDMSMARKFLRSLVGVDVEDTSVSLISSMMTDNYHVLMWFIAVCCAAFAPSAWIWTRNTGGWKWVSLFLLFGLSLWAMTSQSYNPFIYFIF